MLISGHNNVSSMCRAAVALLLAWALICQEVPGQTQVPKPSGPVDPRAMVKPDPKRAKKLAELGSKQEQAGQYTEALAAYEEAARYAPFDVTIVNLGVSLRSRLVRGYMDDAERRAITGDLDGATQQLATALHLDPSNSIVHERLQQMELMKGDSKELPQEPPLGLPQLKPNHTRQQFRLQADSRTVYEQVAAAYGIKAAFDPDLPSRSVKLRLDDVDFDTAMKVLTAETGTFWHALNDKLIFVAADTAEKRRAFEPVIEQTFYLPASTSSTEMTEVVRTVRDLTGAQRIQQSGVSHSVTIRDTIPKVRLAGAIIHNLEKAPGEVLLEIDLLEVDRNHAAKMGITPPPSISLYSVSPALASQLRSATSITALLTILASVFGTAASGGLSSLASAIPPIAAIGGGRSTFLLQLPTFAADFSNSLSLVRTGEQVLLRAQDGKPATFFVGERYPITLSLLSASLGGGGALAQTPAVGGTSTAVQTEQFNVGQGPVSLVSADFRNAGTQDLAVLNEIDNTVTILLNQGTGAVSQFAAATGSPISLGTSRTQAPPVPATIATGSFNSSTDALPDLLVTDPVANTVTVLLENTAGDGTFTIQPNPIAVGNTPSGMVVGTFNSNNNTNPGFVVTNFVDNTYSVFLGNGDGTFQAATGSPFALPSTASGPIAITSADFNSDGIPDLAILNQTTKNVTILQGKGDGTFTEFPNSPVAVGNGAVAIASGALAGSTGPALAIANQTDNTATVYLGNGDGTFTQSSQSPLTTDKAPTGIVISDFAQQSTGGIAVTNRDAGTITVFVDLGSGLFTSALEPAAGTNPTAIVSGPFTGNAFPDIVVTNNISGGAGQVTLLVSPASLVANPSIAQTPYPGSEYVDIGLKIKTTPTLHENKEVTLQMDFDIKSLVGTAVNQIPIISNRTITQTVRLRENETSIVSGLLNLQESKSITGLPGLAKLPGVGYAFGVHNDTFENDELLILITPRRVRIPSREGMSVYAGRGELGGRAALGGGAAAPPVPTPAPEEPPAQPSETPPPAQQAPPAPEQQPPQPEPPTQTQPQPQPPPPQQRPE